MELEIMKQEKEMKMEKEQKNFLDTNLGKIINIGLDAGIRFIFPDMIENEIIKVKDAIFESGWKEKISPTIQKEIEEGKGTQGIGKQNFENIGQIQNIIEKGKLIPNISKILDQAIQTAQKNGILNKDIANILKATKNTILSNISVNMEDMLEKQKNILVATKESIAKWKEEYDAQNFKNMEKEYHKIEQQKEILMPIEKILQEIRKIENIQEILKNNGGNFNFSWQQIEASKILV